MKPLLSFFLGLWLGVFGITLFAWFACSTWDRRDYLLLCTENEWKLFDISDIENAPIKFGAISVKPKRVGFISEYAERSWIDLKQLSLSSFDTLLIGIKKPK